MTIIFFEPFIIKDERCHAKIGEKVIWNCEHFLELLEKEVILDETIFRPTRRGNEELVSLGGWLFDVSSTINQNATYDEIIEGWNLINSKDDKFVLDRMFQFFFRQLVINAINIVPSQFSKNEPLIIELLRLSYWYCKCYKALDGLQDVSRSKRKAQEKKTID